MREAIAIVVLVIAGALRNRTAFPLAEQIGMSPRAVDYMLGGFFEAILAGVITALVWGWKHTFWRAVGLLSAAFIIFDGLQRPVCRLIITDLKQVRPDQNLCEYLTGLPISMWTGWMYFIGVCVLLAVFKKNRGP